MLFQFGIVDQYYSNFEIEIPKLKFQICYFFLGALRAQRKNHRNTAQNTSQQCKNDTFLSAREARPEKK